MDVPESRAMSKACVFLTFSHADVAWKDRVVACLGGHEVELWDDGDDSLDEDRLERLERAMKTAQAAVLLVSESFLASPLIREVQIPVLRRRRDTGELRIYPLLVEACAWRGAEWLDGFEMRSLAGGSDAEVEEALAALAVDISSSHAADEPLPPFEDIVREHYKSMVYFFGRLGIPKEDCHDLAQETFIKAFKGMDSFRRDAMVKTWLHRIARHVWLNRCRELAAFKRQVSLVPMAGPAHDGEGRMEDVGEGDCLGPEDRLLEAERLARVRTALAELPPQRRRCVLLRAQGHKYREIAELMSISLQAVRSHLHQARAQLRELLGEDFSDLF